MFGSSAEAPAGYITMNAGDICAAAKALLDDREAKQKAWDEALPAKLAAWAATLTWRKRFWHSIPKNPAKLVEWYDFYEWIHQRPDIPGLDSRPGTPGTAVEWHSRTRRMPADKQVFINVEEGAVLMTWVPGATP